MAFLLLPGPVALCKDAEPDGAALFKKHCSFCHGGGSKLKLERPLLTTVRMAPIGMLTFDKDKLPDRDVQAIEAFLRSSAAKKAPEPQAPASEAKPTKEKKTWMKGFGTDGL